MTEKQHRTRLVRILTRMRIDGPTKQAVLLNKEFNKLGYKTWLVSGGGTEYEENVEQAFDLSDITTLVPQDLRFSMNPIRVIRALWELFIILRRLKPDIVHTHLTTGGILGRIAARLAGVPVVVHTLHVHPFRGYYDRTRTIGFILTERLGAYFSDSIITLTANLRNELADTYHITSKQRISVLPLGLDLDIYAETPRKQGIFREQFGIPADAPLVGIVGRIIPVKNIALFLEIAKQLHTHNPQMRFVIVGDGTGRAEREAQAKELGLQDAVIFTSWINDMETVYSDLDVLVNTSHNEGTPIPIIEALAAGCPVVASNVGGITDLLAGGQLGKLIPTGNLSAFVEAIEHTINNPSDGTEAQANMLRRYGIERLAQDLDSFYRGLLAQKGLI